MNIIGITGTIGAGKGAIVDYLVNKRGYAHYSVRNYLKEILTERNLPYDRPHMTALANELRDRYSPSYIVEQLYMRAKSSSKPCIIESIRTLGEIEALRNLGSFVLIAVDADPRVRYDRVIIRNSETDDISYDEFIESEHKEMHSENPNRQNLARCIKEADLKLNNDGSLEELHRQIIKGIHDLKKKDLFHE